MIYIYQCKNTKRKNACWIDAVSSNKKSAVMQTYRKLKKTMPNFEHRVISIKTIAKETVIAE